MDTHPDPNPVLKALAALLLDLARKCPDGVPAPETPPPPAPPAQPKPKRAPQRPSVPKSDAGRQASKPAKKRAAGRTPKKPRKDA